MRIEDAGAFTEGSRRHVAQRAQRIQARNTGLPGALTGLRVQFTALLAQFTHVTEHQPAFAACSNQRIHGRVNQLAGRLDEAANNDKVLMGVGLILFWPALFALGGTKQQEADYARLKGEYDAVQQALVAKKCDLGPTPATTPASAAPATAPAPAGATPAAPAPAKAAAPAAS